MQKLHSTSVGLGLLPAGTRQGTAACLWVEPPSSAELQRLEAENGRVVGTCAISPALLEVALIKWAARHGEAVAATWTEIDGGYKVPMPVVRRFEGGTLRLIDGAGSVLALRSAKPAKDATVPALVLMS